MHRFQAKSLRAKSSLFKRFEHFGRGGGFLFCGTTNKKILKFRKFDFEDLHPSSTLELLC